MKNPEYVTFKDLNAELSHYQRKTTYQSVMEDIQSLNNVERFALAGILIASLKVILKGLL